MQYNNLANDMLDYNTNDEIVQITVQVYGKSITLTKRNGKFIKPSELKELEGVGSGLKPAHETWWLARSPLAEPTIAANVLAYGTAGLNIDACRIGTQDTLGRDNKPGPNGWKNSSGGASRATYDPIAASGRWPANFLISHTLLCTEDQCVEYCPARILDAQSGIRPSSGRHGKSGSGKPAGLFRIRSQRQQTYFDQGGASRYFAQFYYCPKASKKDRSANGTVNNTHPTAKNTSLMRYLVRLITPPGGIVLDPFAGSGGTLVTCVEEGFDFIGIEREAEYIEIARARIEHAIKVHAGK